MTQYMLVLHDAPADYAELGLQELSALVQRYVDWVEDLKRSGHFVASYKLGAEGGRMLTPESTRPVPSDGPYAEAKDVIGGAFVIAARDLDEAEAIARTSPHLRGRNRIEIRVVDEESCEAVIEEARRERGAVHA
ncbi:YciI family protein [Phenylobacterium terrae]|uniref:YciI family protein n=1 Tax=Phenylobacterium terrae TaxID=2665495 RepID=A0ABW4N6M1_9CAUL